MKSQSYRGYNQGEQNYKLGMSLLAGLIIPVLFFFVAGTHEKTHPLTIIIAGVYFQYIGVLNLLSYFYEEKCFLFRWFNWLALHLPFPGRGRLIWQGILSFGIGTFFIVVSFFD